MSMVNKDYHSSDISQCRAVSLQYLSVLDITARHVDTAQKGQVYIKAWTARYHEREALVTKLVADDCSSACLFIFYLEPGETK